MTTPHWITHNLYQKTLLAAVASLMYFGIVESNTTFTVTHWIAWLFFTAVFLAALILFPMLARPSSRPKKISKTTHYVATLLLIIAIILIFFTCQKLGFNPLQTVAYYLAIAIMTLGIEPHDRNDIQSHEITKTPQQTVIGSANRTEMQ